MIDYVKAFFVNKDEIEAKFLKLNKECLVKGVYNYNNNKVEYPIKTFLDNMSVRFTETTGYIENSLHKKYNEINAMGNQNHSDFYFCDLIDVLNVLEAETGCLLHNTSLSQLEFGFNLKLSQNPSKVLEENILMYKLKSACYDPKNFVNKKIKKFTFRNYEIKIYNKSLHYGLTAPNDNILRIEVKYKTKKEFNKFGIYSLKDLKSPNNLNNLFVDFLKKFNDLLIVDSYDGSFDMTKKEKDLFVKCTNSNYWISLKNYSHRNTKSNHFERLKKLIRKYNLDTQRIEIRNLILEKFNDLIKTNCYEKGEVIGTKSCA